MKNTINRLLNRTGWELRRIEPSSRPPYSRPRSTMVAGIEWLSIHGFHIKTVLDVGASNGCWSRECMNFFPDATYVLYEPQPVHSDALDAFAESCKRPALLIKKAVGASEGRTFFDASDAFGGKLRKNDKGASTISVELTTIDASTARVGAEGPYLLKLDTHGYEKSILEGAASILGQAEILIIEAYNYRISDEALLFWELCAYLSDRGFRPIDLVDTLHRELDASLWQMDLIFIRSSWEGFKNLAYRWPSPVSFAAAAGISSACGRC
jgi:FkbM family methyltransferase